MPGKAISPDAVNSLLCSLQLFPSLCGLAWFFVVGLIVRAPSIRVGRLPNTQCLIRYCDGQPVWGNYPIYEGGHSINPAAVPGVSTNPKNGCPLSTSLAGLQSSSGGNRPL